MKSLSEFPGCKMMKSRPPLRNDRNNHNTYKVANYQKSFAHRKRIKTYPLSRTYGSPLWFPPTEPLPYSMLLSLLLFWHLLQTRYTPFIEIFKIWFQSQRDGADLGSSVASSADSTPMTAASATRGCSSRRLSSSAGGTGIPLSVDVHTLYLVKDYLGSPLYE
jgi:hypothetical protein